MIERVKARARRDEGDISIVSSLTLGEKYRRRTPEVEMSASYVCFPAL